MKLISMQDFVLEQSKKIMDCELTHLESYGKIVDYANFLKQPLKLEMFVPCDEDGNVLEEPNKKIYHASMSYSKLINSDLVQYQQAKEKVLFEGFEKENNKFLEGLIHNETIETGLKLNGTITLTQNAIKQLGL